MSAGEWTAVAGVVVAVLTLAGTVICALIWIVWPLAQLTSGMTAVQEDLAQIKEFNRARPCDTHSAELKELKEEVRDLQGDVKVLHGLAKA
jgi:nitrate/nitrite-specific signal transduction histidine kinase